MKKTAKLINSYGDEIILSSDKGELLAALQKYGYIVADEAAKCKQLDRLPTDKRSIVIAYCCTPLPTVNVVSTNEAALFEDILREDGLSIAEVNNGMNALNTQRVWQNVTTFVYSHRKRLHSIIMPIIKYKASLAGETSNPDYYLSALELALLSGVEERIGDAIERDYSSHKATFVASSEIEAILFCFWSEYNLLKMITKDAINNPSGIYAIDRAKEICTEYYNTISIDYNTAE